MSVTSNNEGSMFKKMFLIILFSLSLAACGTTGKWAPNDPTGVTQDKMNRDMQGCIQYGDQSMNDSSSLPILSMSIRNSYVEECMKRLGYHKVTE